MGLDRREFMIASAIAALSVGLPVTAAAEGAGVSPGLIIFDLKLVSLSGMASAWAESCAARQACYKGDVATVWFEHFRAEWHQRNPVIGGISTTSSLFCIERLAWGVGLRVRDRHRIKTSAGQEAWRWIIAPPQDHIGMEQRV